MIFFKTPEYGFGSSKSQPAYLRSRVFLGAWDEEMVGRPFGAGSWALFGGGGSGFLDRVVDGEDLGQAGDLEDLEDLVLRAYQSQATLVGLDSLKSAHQDAETCGVEKVHSLEVDDDIV